MNRGEIWYVTKFPSDGCVQESGRPAIIVSNDTGNKFSSVVEVVYLTTKDKKPMPTHVEITSSMLTSTALCEQIHSVSKELLTGYCGKCTEKEMKQIDNALAVSIGLNSKAAENEQNAEKESDESVILALQVELKVYKELFTQIFEKLNMKH